MELSVKKTNLTSENDIFVIRKLLDQIHSYFDYLECPFYSSDLSERDLLLLLIQPSLKRYKLLEWMLSRLEPDLDFYLPYEIGKGDDFSEKNKSEQVDAIAFLKNLGLCYSRVLVPDIVHAKVGPLVQLKFLVRLLRGIRLKSWNRKPVIKKSSQQKDENNTKNGSIENISENDDPQVTNGTSISKKELRDFVDKRICRNSTVKTILSSFKRRFDESQYLEFKDKVYFSVLRQLNERQSKNTNNEQKSFSLDFNIRHVSFFNGMVKLITDELLNDPKLMDNEINKQDGEFDEDEYDDDDSSSDCFTSNDCESYCSLTIHHIATESRSSSQSSSDTVPEDKECGKNVFIPLRNILNEKSDSDTKDKNFHNSSTLPCKSFSTSVSLTKTTENQQDNLPLPKPRYPKNDDSFASPIPFINNREY